MFLLEINASKSTVYNDRICRKLSIRPAFPPSTLIRTTNSTRVSCEIFSRCSDRTRYRDPCWRRKRKFSSDVDRYVISISCERNWTSEREERVNGRGMIDRSIGFSGVKLTFTWSRGRFYVMRLCMYDQVRRLRAIYTSFVHPRAYVYAYIRCMHLRDCAC